ncbi:histidine kinase [Niameybacter massiliensis]|uniref:histidine kinase n=1 Tax=Holtiella tumoricola TaxID=3018743 RepID=A0AA42DL25_9FIRM|nr:sensor histidine kinase [Holtiella tumoricola]MDA3730899.1 histidine kinase [Holtiella tumoricola]
MINNDYILEILQKTIDTLMENKNSILSISETLKTEYEQKKQELTTLQKELPSLFQYTKKLRLADRQLRNQLSVLSSDFSIEGHKKLHAIFLQASEIHAQLLKAEESESTLVRRRDSLELDIKRNLSTIENAENVARQLMASLSYLQTSLITINEENKTDNQYSIDGSFKQYISFITCIENEKLRIARDLHDGPAQQIASAKMHIDICESVITKDLHQGLKFLSNLKRDLSQTLIEVRQILFDLNPAPLEKMDFKDALENMIYSILDIETMNISFFYNIDSNMISLNMQKTLYRIMQELINNIKKHSKATQIILRIYTANDFIYINLMDNGIGFAVPDNLDTFHIANKSYGLSNISTRIAELDGKLIINSDSTNGTSFKIQVPNHTF